jgi:hypothetical protein
MQFEIDVIAEILRRAAASVLIITHKNAFLVVLVLNEMVLVLEDFGSRTKCG